MAYENIELVVAAVTGDIYMTRTKMMERWTQTTDG